MENVDTLDNKDPCSSCNEGYILTGMGAQSGVRISCPVCLGTGLDRVAKVAHGWHEFTKSDTLRKIDRDRFEKKIKEIEKAFGRIGGVPDPEEDWDIEELSENLEPGDMVRVIYNIGLALRVA